MTKHISPYSMFGYLWGNLWVIEIGSGVNKSYLTLFHPNKLIILYFYNSVSICYLSNHKEIYVSYIIYTPMKT